MKNKWLWIIGIVLIILLVAIALILRQVNTKDNKESKGYDTYTVKKESPINIEGKASPQSVKTYNNNSQVGDLVSTTVDDGQTVKQGTQLISYNVEPGKRQKLVDQLNQAQNQTETNKAQQQLNQYDKQINDSMYAAFNGKVNIKDGTDATNGQPILQLVSDEPQVKASITEFDLDKIKKGDKVNVTVNSTGKKGKGEIEKIEELPSSFDSASSDQGMAGAGQENSESGAASQSSNPTVNTPSTGKDGETSKYNVIIGNIDIPIRAGLSLNSEIPLKTMKLPSNVLTKDNQVFVIDKSHKVHKRNVKINRNNDQIFIKKGLKEGDKVIKHPKDNLNDGDKVEVAS
ncbi:efflux RND transporter periplasmic adaptor subunit [Staphylococcus hominis]|uniref:efflux RND transporter periplasmic adaptor subunit n=1 Tax=Staphylococcus hominis TaxID=1290 RepID=UPI000C7D62EF|nr:RND transporter [Staphylococcus hominis]MCI2921918.1 efflux RND transporter periplasmic adaptor subunit [Staphylococcus hominis]MDS3888281.1 efflux RND transporter periplasmic adaptor subunit [Staphylococcus hominis]MDS3899182.1 efflux RND transporter periplasmic adaptor subunit [Staphylococcus hominis]MDS3916584.1 efflux RND transporter periplasmic adaptor subunit [Staphylococcus hominis]PLA22449.1 RND transporter [Staphylococcus hominis]